MVAALFFAAPAQFAMQQSPDSNEAAIYGSVVDSHGNPIGDATVRLEGGNESRSTKTNAAGAFEFSSLPAGKFNLSGEKSNLRSHVATVSIAGKGDRERVELNLEPEAPIPPVANAVPNSPAQAFAFADNPSFQIAGVTDWTAVGGHGSDTTLRTSEALARETLALKPTKDAEATTENAQKRNADQHRLAGERDEKSGDPLGAVHEFGQAVQIDPSEENYFAWGTELLLHRAVWQAQDVFGNGVKAFPDSARMQSALGAALFAGARYEEAARFLCQASDLDPADPEAYLFMGRVQIAAPDPLPCIEPRLARFAGAHPDSSQANYLYAMALLKGKTGPAEARAIEDAGKLLAKAVSADAKCADAYLELGILASSSGDSTAAIDDLNKALAANPELSEAHYRLGVIYDRMSQAAKARHEFELHDQLEKQQAEEAERQRREIKQFVIVTSGEKSAPPQN